MDGVGDFRTIWPVWEFSSRSSGDVVDTAKTLEFGEVFEKVVGVARGLAGHKLVYRTKIYYDTHPQYHWFLPPLPHWPTPSLSSPMALTYWSPAITFLTARLPPTRKPTPCIPRGVYNATTLPMLEPAHRISDTGSKEMAVTGCPYCWRCVRDAVGRYVVVDMPHTSQHKSSAIDVM
jgi:hypothetical protein